MLIYKLYKFLTYVFFPIIYIHLQKRLKKGKEDKNRLCERLGISSKNKTKQVIWFHGASVGESISMLPLIKLILKKYPNIEILVTTGTITSAKLMKEKLPKGAIHQFIPIDYIPYIKKFINHWQPDLCLWFESEFWPNTLNLIKQKNIPLILINGRISNKTFEKWLKFRSFIKYMLNCFDLCLGQTKEDEKRLSKLGAKKTNCLGNIKYAAPALKADQKELEKLKNSFAGKQLFLAAATHHNEEDEITKIYIQLKKQIKNLSLIIAPRHPERGEEIQRNIKNLGLNTALRSKKEDINENTNIYIANTIGELGIFYNLCDIVFIGGSLIPHGGQNFLEAAKLKSAIIVGKYMHNFTEMVENALKENAILQINDNKQLYETLNNLLENDNNKQKLINNSYNFAYNQEKILDNVFNAIEPYLKNIGDKNERS